jgi:transposase
MVEKGLSRIKKKQEPGKKQMSLEVVNPYAAGIGVGSKSHWVAIGQDAQDVREFGVYSEDHQQLCRWLSEEGIASITKESTGTYWQTLFSAITIDVQSFLWLL